MFSVYSPICCSCSSAKANAVNWKVWGGGREVMALVFISLFFPEMEKLILGLVETQIKSTA